MVSFSLNLHLIYDVILHTGRFQGTIEKVDGGIKVNGNKVSVF